MVSELKSINAQFIDLEKRINKIHDEHRMLETSKEKILQRFSLLREHLSLKIDLVQKKFDECLKAKVSYDNFTYPDFQVTELTSYGLNALINVSDSVRNEWSTCIISLNNSFVICIALVTNPST